MQGPSLESLISETNYDRDYHSVTGPTYLSDEEAVALSMETALNQLNNVGVEYGSITPEAAKSFYIFSRESL